MPRFSRTSWVYAAVLSVAAAGAGIVPPGATAELAAGSGQRTVLVSVSLNGEPGNRPSYRSALSGSGRFVAFQSAAPYLVPDDTNAATDVFVRDLRTGQTQRVSVATSGDEANFGSGYPAISADGRVIAFSSEANNLVPGDTNGLQDVFVHDRSTGATTRVSVGPRGRQAAGGSWRGSDNPSVSGDGRYVAFGSSANNLVTGDTRGFNIYVRDRVNRTTTLVSVDIARDQPNGDSFFPSISDDGSRVAFTSSASNLVRQPEYAGYDVFVRNLRAKKTRLVSVTSSGRAGNGDSDLPAISRDGRHVAFVSWADNLVHQPVSGSGDVLISDLTTGVIRRVTVGRRGGPANWGVPHRTLILPVVSRTGRYVAFESRASNLVRHDTNERPDVFRRDMVNGSTRLASTGRSGRPKTTSEYASMSGNGQHVGFTTRADNLVLGDDNGNPDVFIRHMLP